MGIIKKNNKEEIKNEAKNEEVKNMTYTELASKELNSRLGVLIAKEKKINSYINEVLDKIKRKGDDAELVRIVSDLREKQDYVMKEIEQTRRKYEVDFNLLNTARAIDRADAQNKGTRLILDLVPKINEIISSLQDIQKCYGYESSAPFAYIVIKRSMEGLCGSLNIEIPKLSMVNKEALVQEFNERMKVLEENKRMIQSDKDKYLNL